jgi:hypothetical protein
MWIDVVIVALLLGACALLNRADWHTRFLTGIRTAGSPWVKAAHDAVTHVRPQRVRLQAQPPSTGSTTQPGGGPQAGGSRTAERAWERLAALWPGRLAGGKPDSARQVQGDRWVLAAGLRVITRRDH